MRSGAQTLTLLANPLSCLILRTLEEGPKRQTELRRATGSPAQTTLRVQLAKLSELGAIAKNRRNRFPGVLEYELAGPGKDLLSVVSALDRWLRDAPDGPLSLGSSSAKAAIKALIAGWSTTILRALAAKPLTLTELDGLIGSINYPSLERRLGAMRLVGQVQAHQGDGRGTPYRVTEWTRRGLGPLVSAARWERLYAPQRTAPIGKIDVEAAFLLAMPLLRLPDEARGTCRMAMEVSDKRSQRMAGVLVEARQGRISSCSTRLEGYPDAWTSGSPTAWLRAMTESDTDSLELGGSASLARFLLDALHKALFADSRIRS